MASRGRPKKNKKLANAIGEAFLRALRNFPDVNRAEAAALLGMTRDGLQRILRGDSIPRPEVLSRGAALFGVTIEYEGHEFGSASFPAPTSPHDATLRQ